MAVTALPVRGGHTELAGRYLNAPMIGVVSHVHPHWLGDGLKYLVAAMAAVTLVAAANSAMLGLSRLAYSLSTNRQIPSGLGRLHPERSTPYVLIIVAGVIAAGARGDREPRLPRRHLRASARCSRSRSRTCRSAALRYSEPDRDRPYRDAVVDHAARRRAAAAGCVRRARFGGRPGGGADRAPRRALRRARLDGRRRSPCTCVYRRAEEVSLLRRVTVSPRVLRAEPPVERDYGSILVPLFGTDLDDDIVQTAALLVAGEQTDEAAIDAATIEAVWMFVMPMSLPLDASLPEAQIKHARQVLARAKAVGEEYTGVQVATATVRTRRAGYAIVDEARRRGVEAIVLGAEEPSHDPRRRASGGRGGTLEAYVGDVTKYVVRKADCRVILDGARRARPPVESRVGQPGERPNGLTCGPMVICSSMFVLIVGAGRVGSALAKSALADGPRSVGAGRGPALARAPRRGRGQELGGRRRPVHGRDGARDRRADPGGHRARRRVHRLDRRRQHEPRRSRRSCSSASASRR